MKKLLLLFTAVVAVVVLPMFAEEPSGFAKKVELTLSDAAKTALGDGSFANVPVLVKLSTTIQGFSYGDFQDEHGADMVFSDGNGTIIPHEVDTWDPSGTSLVWLKPSSLSTSIEKVVMYFGNAENPESSASDVWSGYTGVWHFEEASTLTAEQATTWPTAKAAYANSTATAGLEGFLSVDSFSGEAGRFGKCFRTNDAGCKSGKFNNGGVWVNDAGTDSPLDCGDTFTISGWFSHPTEQYYYDHIFYKRSQGDNKTDKSNTKKFTGGFAIELKAAPAATPQFDIRGGSGTSKQGGAINAYNTWSYLTFVFEGQKITVYENGVQEFTSTGISAVTDNDAPLGIGTRPDIAFSGCTGDANWCGWIDEVRLCDDALSADWLAVEYKAMTTDFFEFGEVEACSKTIPKLTTPELRWTGSQWELSTLMTSGVGRVSAVYTDVAAGTSVTNVISGAEIVSGENAFTDYPTLAGNRVYSYMLIAYDVDGNYAKNVATDRIYTGTVSVSATNGAEAGMTPGEFVVTLGSAATSDLNIFCELEGAAVMGRDYRPVSGGVTIPAGESSATIAVDPLPCPQTDTDVTVVLKMPAVTASGAVESSLTIVNDAWENGRAVRYVTKNGSDENDGMTFGTSFLTVAKAIADLGAARGRVYIDSGTYVETATGSALTIDEPIELVGIAEGVVLKPGVSNSRVLYLDHADAVVRGVTIANGNLSTSGQKGANVYLNAGTIVDCLITNGLNNGNSGGEAGGNIYVHGGRVMRCRITGGSCPKTNTFRANRVGGNALYMDGGVVENCLIDGNICPDSGMATCVVGGGLLANCTITRNASQCGGVIMGLVGSKKTFGTVRNCIIYGNTATAAGTGTGLECYADNNNKWNIDYAGTSTIVDITNLFENCIGEVAMNDNCFVAEGSPFVADDGRYIPSAQCIDKVIGYAGSGAISTTDFLGAKRQQGSAVDLGCCEAPSDSLSATFTIVPESYLVPTRVRFNAEVENAQGEVTYSWDLNGDGSPDIVTNAASFVYAGFTAGSYNCSLTVSDGVSTVALDMKTSLAFSPKVLYVAADSENPVYPYLSRETAAKNLQDALSIAFDGATIWVSPGTYSCSASAPTFDVTNAVQVIGETGKPEDVILQNTTGISGDTLRKVVTVNNRHGLVANVTIRNGQFRNKSSVAGLNLGTLGGTVTNCIIRDCYHNPSYYTASSAIYMSAGLVTHCVVTNNSINGKSTQGNDAVAATLAGGAIENSFIGANKITGNGTGKCFAIRATGGRIVNCDIIGNDLSSTNELAGALDVSGTAEVLNTVVFGNTKREIIDNGDETTTTVIVPALVTGATAETALTACATDRTITAAAFADYANGRFTPAYGGPLFNAGVTPAGWAGSGLKDLAGHKRVYGSSVDIGCYEYFVPSGLQIILR